MDRVSFPTASPSGITCLLTCASEVSEVPAASEFRVLAGPAEAPSRIGREVTTERK
jgi:hypothetical protein